MPSPLLPHQTVLAIDPGNAMTAYCLLRGDRKILGFDKIDNDTFRSRLRTLVQIDRPTIVACEMIQSFGLSVGASVFETCVEIGRFLEIVGPAVPWVQVGRLQVKLAICKSPKANDSTIRTALIDSFGAPGTKKNPGPTFGITADCWAALGLAETVRSGEYAPYVPVALRNN